MEKKEDINVLAHIKELTEKEEHLYGKEDLSDDDVKNLHSVKTQLDQYWDLLRQRRAFREAGEDPERARLRSDETIKNYKN
jgi:hypothetical protein